jgi:hypothetical protein
VRPAAGPAEVASAHVATELGGQDGPGRPPPTRGLAPHVGQFRGAFLNTGLEEVLPALTGYLGATPVAGVPSPAVAS